jgi:precorrin-3B C17-methyltransferase
MKIYVIGIGPGGPAEMTPRALAALRASDVVAGYALYIDLIRAAVGERELLSTPMRRETERCVAARDAALAGKTVAVVSSGDAGVYGMAGLMYEVCEGYPEVEIEVVPGITAATSAAAVLGAPLTHDFAVVSLSDLLTPWETIEKRLDCAAAADFVICLYNPASAGRTEHLRRACDILLRHRNPETPCGTAKNIGRDGEEAYICTLAELRERRADMLTTVIIGSGATRVVSGKLVTPRGYAVSEGTN